MCRRDMASDEVKFPRKNMTWKALAFESELICKAVLTKEFLPENLWESYKNQVSRLKSRMEQLHEVQDSSIHKHLRNKFSQIEERLKFLNPENRIQVNFEFFTKKIHYFKNRLERLRDSLLALSNTHPSSKYIQFKRLQIEQEIKVLEQSLADTDKQREALLA